MKLYDQHECNPQGYLLAIKCYPNAILLFVFLSLIPQMFIFHNVTITYPANFTQCTTRGSFVTHWQETAYNMFTFSCLFLLPLVIMIICYTRIFIQISKRMTKKNCKLSAVPGSWMVRTYSRCVDQKMISVECML